MKHHQALSSGLIVIGSVVSILDRFWIWLLS